ncbi:MAG: hypothetical protein ACJ76V_11635 [Thermoleophilaceae bacterium]
MSALEVLRARRVGSSQRLGEGMRRLRSFRGPLLLLFAGAVVSVFVYPWSAHYISDIWLYWGYGGDIVHGHLPYQAFNFEYPPLAAVVIGLPAIPTASHGLAYEGLFGALMLLFAIGCLVCCADLAALTGGSAKRAAYAFAVLPLATGALAREHLDLAPVFLLLAGLLLVARRSVTGGFGVLGIGTITKAFPLLAAPPAFAWLWGRGERRAAVRGALVLGVIVVVIGAAVYALSPSGARYAWDYQVNRPVQVESAPAMVLQAIDAAGGAHVRRFPTHNGDGMTSSASGAVSAAFMALLAGAVLAATLLAARGPRDGPLARRRLVLAALTAVAASPAFGKVLSPQFLIWTWPLFAIAVAWGERALAGLMLAATVLTFVEFPFHYFDAAKGETGAVLLVATRDAVLIAAVGLAFARLARLSARREEQLLDRASTPVFARLD